MLKPCDIIIIRSPFLIAPCSKSCNVLVVDLDRSPAPDMASLGPDPVSMSTGRRPAPTRPAPALLAVPIPPPWDMDRIPAQESRRARLKTRGRRQLIPSSPSGRGDRSNDRPVSNSWRVMLDWAGWAGLNRNGCLTTPQDRRANEYYTRGGRCQSFRSRIRQRADQAAL